MQLETLVCVPAMSIALIVCLLGLRIGLKSLQRLAASLVGQWRIELPPLAFLDGSQSFDLSKSWRFLVCLLYLPLPLHGSDGQVVDHLQQDTPVIL